tara:strand:+ start:1524 stop:3101 length:1578 start_codon:yes stop_codon:yes gene_type:complete
MALTYTDVRNRQAQADALESVNDYLDKRRQARSSMKQAEVKPKQIEKWVDDKGNVHITTGIQGPTGEFTNINTQVIEGVGKKEVADDPKTIQGARQLAAMYGRTEEFEPRFQAFEATENVDGTVSKTFIDDIYRDITANVKKDDKAKPLSIKELRTGMGFYTDLPPSYKARLDVVDTQVKSGKVDIDSREVQDTLKDIKKDYQNWSEKAKTEPTLYNINTLQTGIESMPEGDAKKTATRLIGLMGNIKDKNSKEYAAYGQRIATLTGQTPTSSSKKSDLDINNVRTMIQNTFEKDDPNYIEAMTYLESAEKLPAGSPSYIKRLEQAAAVKLNIKTPDKDFVPDFDAEKNRLSKIMVQQGREANKPTKDASGKYIPGWGRTSRTDFKITEEMKKTHRQFRETELARDLAEDDIIYEGQVVHKPEQIRLKTEYGVKGIEDTQWYKDNIEKSVEAYLKENFGKSTEENDAAIRQIIFDFVKERQDKFGATRFKDMYYTILIDAEPDRHEFDRVKNMFEQYGMALTPRP